MKSKLASFESFALTREQVREVQGGLVQFHCQCNGVGTWDANYSGGAAAFAALEKYCSNGGNCSEV